MHFNMFLNLVGVKGPIQHPASKVLWFVMDWKSTIYSDDNTMNCIFQWKINTHYFIVVKIDL